MPEYKLRYVSKKENCTICWDDDKKIWVKVKLEKVENLPEDVKEQLQKDREKAALVLETGKYISVKKS